MCKYFLLITTYFIILLYTCLNLITIIINSKLKSKSIIFQKLIKISDKIKFQVFNIQINY